MKILFAIAFIIAACSSNESLDLPGNSGNSDHIIETMDLESVPFAKQSPPTSESELQSADISQKLVRSGGINFRSEVLEKDYEEIKGMLGGFDAYL